MSITSNRALYGNRFTIISFTLRSANHVSRFDGASRQKIEARPRSPTWRSQKVGVFSCIKPSMHKIHLRTNGRRVGSGPAASAGRSACPRPNQIMIALFIGILCLARSHMKRPRLLHSHKESIHSRTSGAEV